MSEPTVVKSAELKEGYWVRIGDESYAVHRVLSVSVIELPPVPEEEGNVAAICCFAGIGIGIFAGVQTNSWVVGLILSLLLLYAVGHYFSNFYEKEKKKKEERRESFRNVAIELDKKGPRIVAAEIPKADAERLRMEIESIVADAARAEAEKSKNEQVVGGNRS